MSLLLFRCYGITSPITLSHLGNTIYRISHVTVDKFGTMEHDSGQPWHILCQNLKFFGILVEIKT